MNTKQFDCAIELAQTLNFNRAAENLLMSQPSLSYQIRTLEEEIGFKLFDRTGRGAVLTPAGAQFISSLKTIRADLKRAVDLGKSFGAQYNESISIGLTWRSSLLALPEAMGKLSEMHPSASVTPVFNKDESIDAFLRGSQDIVFARDVIRRLSEVEVHPLYRSRIYVITRKDDPLATLKRVYLPHLSNRMLMVNDKAPASLRELQHRAVKSLRLKYLNSDDYASAFVNVAAGKGVCLAPGYLNDGMGEFAWTPLECQENVSCVLLTHANERRETVHDLVKLLQSSYESESSYASLV